MRLWDLEHTSSPSSNEISVPPILNTIPMLRFRFISDQFIFFSVFGFSKKNFEKLFFCRSGLRKFFRHPNYMVSPTLNAFLMLPSR